MLFIRDKKFRELRLKRIYIGITLSVLCLAAFSQNKNTMDVREIEGKLQKVLNKTIDNKRVFGCSFAVQKGDFSWQGMAGNFGSNQPYFIASTTKLFTTAIVMQLQNEGKLNWEDSIAQYLPSDLLNQLHVYQNKEYSKVITIQHLLAHTSGLPDYFQGKESNGSSLEMELKLGKDQYWSAEQAIDRTKKMKALFKPGASEMAHYSDANFQLLGLIIEKVTGMSYAQNCDTRIIKFLSLKHTYLYTDITDTSPISLYYQSAKLAIPKAMTSFGADGGIVSTSEDMLIFIQAFFKGKLFPVEYLEGMQKNFHKIFFPMRSGIGIHQFKLPWILNPTGAVPVFIGHSGLSGALAYYCPKEDMYFVGTVNQIANPELSFKTMIKLSQVLKK